MTYGTQEKLVGAKENNDELEKETKYKSNWYSSLHEETILTYLFPYVGYMPVHLRTYYVRAKLGKISGGEGKKRRNKESNGL